MLRLATLSRQSAQPCVWRRAAAVTLSLLVLPGAIAGCGRQVNLKEALAVTGLSGGWYDAGIVNGKNKLLPSATFQLEKKSGEDVGPLALNVLFKRLVGGVEEEFEDVYIQRVEFTEGDRTKPLVVRPEAGYTGEAPQTRAQMFENSQFVDVRAIIFVRQGSTWIELARLDLPRTLVTE